MASPYFTYEFTGGPIYVGSDLILEISNLREREGGAAVDVATVTAAILDAHGNTVVASTGNWDNYGQGTYRVEVESTALSAVTSGERYIVRITVSLGADLSHTQDHEVEARGSAAGKYNWFGATPEQVVALFPGAIMDDFGTGPEQSDQSNIERELDSATDRVLASCPKRLFDLLHRVPAELIVSAATDGQTVAYLGLAAAKTTGVAIYKNYEGCPKSPGADDELVTTAYAVARENSPGSANHGKVKITLTSALAKGATLHASYDLDTSANSYVFSALADLVTKLAGGVLGSRLFAMRDSVWGVVEEYRKAADAGLAALAKDELIPAEVRRLALCADFDRSQETGAIESVDWHRA